MPLPTGTPSWPSLMGTEEESEPLPAEAPCRVKRVSWAGLALSWGPQLCRLVRAAARWESVYPGGRNPGNAVVSTKITEGSRTKQLLVPPFAHVRLSAARRHSGLVMTHKHRSLLANRFCFRSGPAFSAYDTTSPATSGALVNVH